MMVAKKTKPKTPKKAKKSSPAKVVAKKTSPARKPVATRPEKSVPKTATAAPAKKSAAKSAAVPAAPSPVPAGKASPVAKAPAVAKDVVAKGVRKSPLLPLSPREDGETSEGSLLAGPRNVQPYIAKRGEQYMGKDQLEHFRHILLSWKQDLMEEVDRTVSHMKDEAANFPDPNDRATQEEEFSLELRTRDRERKLIRKIDEALKRIEDGSYGYCLETGEQIGIKRLEARPVATLSIEAQERRERREKQYGERDDRYR
jgi:DnaK suppressor protein